MSLQLRARAELKLRQREKEKVKWPAHHVVGPDEETPVPFHVGQMAAWEATERIIALLAGTQGGKTGFGPWWLYREIYGNEEEGFVGKGRGDYIAATATYDLFKLKMLPSMRQVFGNILKVGRYWSSDRVIELRDPDTGDFWARRSDDRMWGRIILRSADSGGSLESATAKAAWLDEAGQDRFAVAAWRAIIRRLSLHLGRTLITTTLYNLGWTKEKIIDEVKSDDGVPIVGSSSSIETFDNGAECEVVRNSIKNICLIQFDSIVNPSFPVEEYIAAQNSMPDDEFLMFYRGRAATLRGLIFDCFNSRFNKAAAFDVPTYWPTVVGVDPVGDRVAALWIAFDSDHAQLHVFQEYCEPFGVTSTQHGRNILDMSVGHRILFYVGGGPSERQARTDWSGFGLPVIAPEITAVWIGLDKVYELFKTKALIIHDCCENLLAEIKSYRRKRDKSGNVIKNEIQNKNAYHMIDCARYSIVGFYTIPDMQEIIYRPAAIR